MYFAIGSRSTNKSLQTAPIHPMAGGESDLGTSTSHTVTSLDHLPTTSQAVVSSGEGGIPPALASFIAQQFRLRWPPNNQLIVLPQFRLHRHNNNNNNNNNNFFFFFFFLKVVIVITLLTKFLGKPT